MPIRPARRRDLPALTEIYNHWVVHSHVTFDVDPYTVDERTGWLGHYARVGPFRLLVAERDGTVVGYASSSPFRPKPAYLTSVEVSIYLHPDHLGRGEGAALYRNLFATLADEPIHRAYAGVALPNDASIALHKKFGFLPIGTFTEVGHKFGSYWDVQWFERPVP